MATRTLLTIKAIPLNKELHTSNHRSDITDAVEFEADLKEVLYLTQVTDQVEWDRETYLVIFIEKSEAKYNLLYRKYFTIIPESLMKLLCLN